MDKLNHVAIVVSDIPSTTHWYLSSFDCELLQQDTTEALIQFDNLQVQLVLPSQVPAHLAFERKDAASFGALQDQKNGTRSTYLSDPSGNIVEIVEKNDTPEDE